MGKGFMITDEWREVEGGGVHDMLEEVVICMIN